MNPPPWIGDTQQKAQPEGDNGKSQDDLVEESIGVIDMAMKKTCHLRGRMLVLRSKKSDAVVVTKGRRRKRVKIPQTLVVTIQVLLPASTIGAKNIPKVAITIQTVAMQNPISLEGGKEERSIEKE